VENAILMTPARTPASPFYALPILRSDEFTAGSPNWQESVKDFDFDKGCGSEYS
jgi:hypothetical protein